MTETPEEEKLVQIPQTILDGWEELCNEVQSGPFKLQSEEPIMDMMKELAKISNACFEHYIRLHIFQHALAEMPGVNDVKSGPAITNFLSSLPKT